MAWNSGSEFLEICGTWQELWSQISSKFQQSACELAIASGQELTQRPWNW
jgi:hypothetical protein